jgi:hypothetical protein
MAIKTAADLAAAAKHVALNCRTLYVMGCFGAPMTAANRDYYCRNHSYNQQTVRSTMIKSATAEVFGFDCSGLIKGLLWGWTGDHGHKRGGASYASNGVPDKNANQMIALCKDATTDFSKIEVGELLWMDGHVGIYIGAGKAVECTPSWKNGVQITEVRNVNSGAGNGRKWTKHGKLPWVTYVGSVDAPAAPEPDTPATPETKSVDEIAVEVIRGKWGNGAERKTKLAEAGYDYTEVQAIVNKLLKV